MAFEMVRFNGRYYIEDTTPPMEDMDDQDWDFDVETAGQEVLDSIPSRGYRKWLKQMRTKYAAKQRYFDRYVFPISGAPHDPTPSRRQEFIQLPSELPQAPWGPFNLIINLDREVFTVNYDAHYKLGDIPRDNGVWDLVFPGAHHESRLAFPALELPERVEGIGYASRTVTPRSCIEDPREHWLVRVLAEVINKFATTIRQFGREWAPGSFPFRELTFALLWIASGKAKFLSFPRGTCPHRGFELPDRGYFGQDLAGESAPLFEFGSLFHRRGQPSGVSPTETMYWFDDVLISLVLVVDGGAVTAAVAWGLEQGRSNFQLIVMSLFEVVLGEVSTKSDQNSAKDPFVKISDPLQLSPLREEECMSTPRECPDPVKKDIEEHRATCSHFALQQDNRSKTHFYPGFASLIKFLDVAARRCSAVKSTGMLPAEMYCKILDHVDYPTWRTCLTVSPAFRSYCLLKCRIDDRWRIVPGPARYDTPFFSFDVEDRHTMQTIPLKETKYQRGDHGNPVFNWMPIVGAEPRALMVNVVLDYQEDWGDVAGEIDREEDVTDVSDESE
ncbi:hypothetical protein C8A00DRAFT_30540 [Chaetomidium leptoderma]|uniref:F-box domain-containing protein n=1 Tax=Chaetomidium leptoderma TaxID=669021 RepID=A0AAN6VSL9_9PEZI|nr:hypothetical protein C8A00DRAFT_30540 [Chaetomidium leptoderma]